MKSNGNTDMDRLMRRFGRRGGEAPSSTNAHGGDSRVPTESLHLDPDEMNAYAEGALPQSARSRYFAHLADCDSCRKLVTDLTLAAASAQAVTDRVGSADPSQRKSWRAWIAALLSPPVLRYAVPAVALFAVIIVAIVAMRTQRDESAVAQKNEAERTYAPSTMSNFNSTTGKDIGRAENHSAAENSASSNIQLGQPAQPTASASPAPMKTGPVQEAVPKVPLEDGARPASTPASTPASAIEENNPFGEVAKRAERDVAAQTGAAPPAPATVADTTSRDKLDDQKKEKVAGKDEDAPAAKSAGGVGGVIASETRANESRPMAGRRAAGTTQSAPVNRPDAPRRKQPEDLAAERESSSETKSVGGRKFRRQGDAWVDTAYRASLATTNVARGSEQYRALVADEPGLRTITQNLGGEVFVVWKSRAYRFY